MRAPSELGWAVLTVAAFWVVLCVLVITVRAAV